MPSRNFLSLEYLCTVRMYVSLHILNLSGLMLTTKAILLNFGEEIHLCTFMVEKYCVLPLLSNLTSKDQFLEKKKLNSFLTILVCVPYFP